MWTHYEHCNIMHAMGCFLVRPYLTNLEKPWEDICGLSSNHKQPGVEFPQAVVQVLQRLQQKPKEIHGIIFHY